MELPSINSIKGRPFRLFAGVTIATVYILILLGGIVRSTGSGLGCPDWPRCFGRWVPPTEVSQLPPDYKTRYAEDGLPPEKVVFNPVNTWIEYLNRLAGALTGIFIAIAAVLAWRGYGLTSRPFLLTFSATLLTGVQGYIGSKVVSTALAPSMITIHNVLAQLIVYLLIAAYWLSRSANGVWVSPRVRTTSYAVFVLVLVQFYLGLQVRQWVDAAANAGMPKTDMSIGWFELQSAFWLHRSFSWVVLGAVAYITFLAFNKREFSQGVFKALAAVTLASIVANVVLGLLLQSLGLPAWAQPLHLLFGSLVLGSAFSMAFIAFQNRKTAIAVLA